MKGEPIRAVPKPQPKLLAQRAKQAAKQLQQRKVYAEVNARDGNRCRGCGRLTSATALNPEARRHHHHVRFRSRGGQDTTANVLLLCGRCHALLHAHQLTIVGSNANQELRFVRRQMCG